MALPLAVWQTAARGGALSQQGIIDLVQESILPKATLPKQSNNLLHIAHDSYRRALTFSPSSICYAPVIPLHSPHLCGLQQGDYCSFMSRNIPMRLESQHKLQQPTVTNHNRQNPPIGQETGRRTSSKGNNLLA